MTDIATSRPASGDQESTARVAKEQAANVGHTAADGGGQVLRSAAEQGRQVAAQAGSGARDLYTEAHQQLRSQASEQQRRAAGGLRSVGEELRTMADKGGGSGVATQLAGRASGTADRLAGWLEGREPGAVLDEVKQYARRHPGAFLAGAAVLGVLAGRLTRGLAADATTASAPGDGGQSGDTARTGATAAPATAGTDVHPGPGTGGPSSGLPPYAGGRS